MADKRVGGIFASSFIAGVLLAAAIVLLAPGLAAAQVAGATADARRESIRGLARAATADSAKALATALEASGHSALAPQYVVLVDRSPKVQAVMVFWGSPDGGFEFIGASPASTGQPAGMATARSGASGSAPSLWRASASPSHNVPLVRAMRSRLCRDFFG
jgi:hypothetical protein